MGLRGPSATPLSQRRRLELELKDDDGTHPWQQDGLSRPDRVIAFCESLAITSGRHAGKPLTLRPWQKRFIRAVYTEDKSGRRPVRTAIMSMGRKNGKTQLAAVLAICHLSGPEAEDRGEVYSCANDRFQASKIFNEMCAMILQQEWLRLRINVIRFKKELEDLKNGSMYAALSKEAKTKFGLNPSFVIYDELGQTADRSLYDAMDSAMGARDEPLMLVISTQAADDHAPLSQLIDYGEKINRREIKDPSFHCTLYAADDDLDPFSAKAWRQANPALDDFRSLEDVKRLAGQAQRMPSMENSFRNLILNQRVAGEARFLEPQIWKLCGGKPEIPQGARVYAGLDLGSTRDLSAFVIVWKGDSDVYHVKCWCWLPGDPQHRADQDAAPYPAWIKAGDLIAIGETTDPRIIARKIAEVNGTNRIDGLAFDRWRVAEIKRELDQIGVSIPLIEHGQGFKDMSPAVDLLERCVVQKRLRHGMHPLLTMAASNAVVARDPAGGRKLDKAKSSGRIDPLQALAMALSAAALRGEKQIDIDALIC
jgi:phage terminase large subunit-like protein